MITGIGIDIIEIDRIERAINRWGNHFLKTVFTDKEIAHVTTKKFPYQHYAVRFAAKEAIVKAVGDNSHISWKDICIRNDKNGTPFAHVNKNKVKGTIRISLSHSKNYAVANAIISSP